MSTRLKTTLYAGFSGGIAMNAAMLITFRLMGFGWNGGGILLDPSHQSEKLIAVWTRIEPLPLVVSKPASIIAGLMIFGIIHAFIYQYVAPAWPTGFVKRSARFAGLIFLMTYLFWEFFTPFNMLGEPAVLIALELAFWAVIAVSEAFAIALVSENSNS